MAISDLITTVVIDDHPAIVAGVRAWCAAATPPIQVVDDGARPAVAWTGPGATADVVLFDLHLTGKTPAYHELRRLIDTGRQVVVYTTRDDPESALTCLDLGVSSYLTKAEGATHLVAALRAAAKNLPYTPPSLARAMTADTTHRRPNLTLRESDVLVSWFACESKELVAKKLNLSVRTVNTYIDRIRIKYANIGRHAPTKAALVARAIQDGLINLDDI